jgi:hypothetical protein
MSRHDFDHAGAFAIYESLQPPNRTYAEVARRVGASQQSVRRWAARYDWEGKLEAARERAMAAVERTHEQRTKQLLRIADRAFELVEAGLDPEKPGPTLDLETVFSKFPEIHRVYRLEIGEATDNVALAEVQAGFRTAMRVAIETVRLLLVEKLGEKEADEFTREYRALFLPAVNEALSLGESGVS